MFRSDDTKNRSFDVTNWLRYLLSEHSYVKMPMIARIFFNRSKIGYSSLRICIVDFDSQKYQCLIKSTIGYLSMTLRLAKTRLSIRNHSKRKRECSTVGISMRSTWGSRSVLPSDVSASPSVFVSFAVSTDLVSPDFLELRQISVTSNDRRFRIS